MSWTFKSLCFALGFVAATGIEAARADDAYLCEDGRIIYVKLGQLEKLKQSEPCIAAYFGLKVDPNAAKEPASRADGAPSEPQKQESGLPLRAMQDKPVIVGPTAPVRRAPPKAAEGTDFRNVQILNAATKSAAVFVHAR
jgi:hypothetical protein